MSSIKTIFLIGLALLFFYAAASGQVASPTVAIGEADAGRTIELRQGDTLVVTLNGDLAGGYTWTRSPVRGAVLEQIAPAEALLDSGDAGTPARIALKFEAANPGQTDLKLVYHLAGQKNSPTLQTFEVTVIVK
jgi:predicted secreted protein